MDEFLKKFLLSYEVNKKSRSTRVRILLNTNGFKILSNWFQTGWGCQGTCQKGSSWSISRHLLILLFNEAVCICPGGTQVKERETENRFGKPVFETGLPCFIGIC